jgi:hypothetical protein
VTLFVTQFSTAFCLQPFNTSTYFLENTVFHLLKVKIKVLHVKQTSHIFRIHKTTTFVCVCVCVCVCMMQCYRYRYAFCPLTHNTVLYIG